MTTIAPTTAWTEVLSPYKVIDTDTHFCEPHDLWISRAPAAYKERLPHLRKDAYGRDFWFVEGDQKFAPLGMSVVHRDGSKGASELWITDFEDLAPGTYDLKERLAVMDRLGIYAQIVYPNAASFSGHRLLAIRDQGLRNLCISLYNDAVAELQRDSGGRLLPQAILPFWDIDEMLAEARRCIDLGFTGFVVPDRPEEMDLPDYGTPHYDGFFELCNDTRKPINFHIGGTPIDLRKDVTLWTGYLGRPRQNVITSVYLFLDNAKVMMNLLMSDLWEKFPNLKFTSVESGIGWISFLLEALEYQFNEMVASERAKFTLSPKERFKESVYGCFWFEDQGVRALADLVGVNTILFETDYPHPTCLYPDTQEHVAKTMLQFTPAERQRMLQDNAAELYQIKIPVA